jgi:hypothetical protein
MKYIITSKDEFAGNSINDKADPLSVTEICTELIITRLYLIDLLKKGDVSKTDTIVCIDDRKCLYENIFDHVISYKDFKEIGANYNEVIDLLEPSLFDRLAGGPVETRLIPYLPFYRNWDRDKKEILNVRKSSLEGYNTDKPFVCLVIRKRQAWSEKNMSDQFWRDVISLLENANINVFVFGKEADTLCTDKTTYIKNFQDWCTIVQHKNCKHVASTMSGGVYPLLVFGNSLCNMTIIDNTGLMQKCGHDPSFYHECVNFAKINISFLQTVPTTKSFYYEITKSL